MAKESKTVGTVKLPEGVTQEMVDVWKKQNGEDKVKVAFLPLDDDNKEFHGVVLKVPGRRAMSMYEKFENKDPDKAKSLLINECCLYGKERVNSNDELFFTCFGAIAELMPIRKAVIKNC